MNAGLEPKLPVGDSGRNDKVRAVTLLIAVIPIISEYGTHESEREHLAAVCMSAQYKIRTCRGLIIKVSRLVVDYYDISSGICT